MYEKHFKLREQPFGSTPDPKFLYFSPEHAEALAALHYGLMERRGLQVLSARAGMGKTTLLHYLLERWKGRAETAFVFHPPETREQMIAAVLRDLGLKPDPDYGQSCRLLHALAVESRRQGKRLFLIFDEAQHLAPALLEEIRLLSNFESPEEKWIEIILAGQPALEQRLASEECEQLRQRLSICARLREIDAADVRRYVEHRLRVAGRQRGRLFTRRAFSLLAEASQGIPRNINAICFEALSLAWAEGKQMIGEREIRQAVSEIRQTARPAPASLAQRAPRRLRWAGGMAALGLLVGALAAREHLRPRPPAARPAEPATVAATAAAPSAGEPTAAPMSGVQPSQATAAEEERLLVQPSETLQQIALRKYGRWNLQILEQIQKGNPWLRDPDRLPAGRILVLPSRESWEVQRETPP